MQIDSNTSIKNIDIQYIKGVGPKRLKYLHKLDIYTVEDILYYFPKRHEDRSEFIPINQCEVNRFNTVKGVISQVIQRKIKKLDILEVELSDMTGVVVGVWFNQGYLKKQFKVGAEIILCGRVKWRKRKQMDSPDYELLTSNSAEDLLHTGRLVPIYGLTEGLNQRVFRQIIKNTLDLYKERLVDIYPAKSKISYSIDQIHFPDSYQEKQKAHDKLVFNEFLLLQIGIQLRRKKNETAINAAIYFEEELFVWLEEFKKVLPFKLTTDQKKVIQEIIEDLIRNKNLNRLLQGDVGSGKTVVAAFAIYVAVKKGYQSAVLAPTEILAEQHYKVISEILSPFGFKIAILIGDRTPKEKRHFKRLLARGDINVLIGTHAIIQEDVEFKNLAMTIIDEQHRFGVDQRSKLKEKTYIPDILLMSATPIPRSLGLTIYGDIDKSVLYKKPPGRGKVTTHWVSSERLVKVYDFIAKQSREGYQSFIICPLVDESERLQIEAATKKYQDLKNEIFSDLNLGLIHGRMKSKEKDAVMSNYAEGKINILVSTTVIEVGIDIPKATVMLIENAERFGLAQLHQLRGRIGRNGFRSYCILHGDPKTEEAEERLKIMEKTNDGFKIAEADFCLRGPGEILGTKQHGLPQLRIGNLINDFSILEKARIVAEKIIKNDPQLKLPKNQKMKDELKTKYQYDFTLYDVG